MNTGKKTLDLSVVEASGYPMLAMFAVYLTSVLSGELERDFRYRPQYEVVKNPSTDSCIILLMGARITPVVM